MKIKFTLIGDQSSGRVLQFSPLLKVSNTLRINIALMPSNQEQNALFSKVRLVIYIQMRIITS